jgi:hypothetical protein
MLETQIVLSTAMTKEGSEVPCAVTQDRMVEPCEQVQIGIRPWSVILEIVQSVHVHISMKSAISAY